MKLRKLLTILVCIVIVCLSISLLMMPTTIATDNVYHLGEVIYWDHNNSSISYRYYFHGVTDEYITIGRLITVGCNEGAGAFNMYIKYQIGNTFTLEGFQDTPTYRIISVDIPSNTITLEWIR